MSADKFPWQFLQSQSLELVIIVTVINVMMGAFGGEDIFSRQMEAIVYLYNNQINARALIGQSAMVYCASKPMEKSRVF